MKSIATSAAALLLVGAAIAAPTPEAIEKMTARRHERMAKRLDRVRRTKSTLPSRVNGTADTHTYVAGANSEVQYDSNWVGAVQIGSGITEVTGTFTNPSVTGGSGSESYGAATWVGIDGDTCQSAILQTGVSGVVQDGEPQYAAWYEWYPNYSYTFEGFEVNPGDSITATVVSTSDVSGTAKIVNHSTGRSVTHTFSNQGEYGSLCNTNAEWIVEDFESGDSQIAFADFGTVTFTGASYKQGGSTYGTSGSTIIDIKNSEGEVVATASLPSNSEVRMQYTG